MAEIPSAYHEFDQVVFTDCGMNALFGVGDCDLYADGSQLFNHRPNAVAGEDRLVNPGELVLLNASESYDQDGEIEAYSWTQLSGSPTSIEFSDSVIAQLIMPEEGENIDIELMVIDNELASGADTIRLVFNQPPNADAGEDQQVGYSSVVILDLSLIHI